MSYEEIDSILSRWATDNSLTLKTQFRDLAVRSVELGSQAGERFQLWIEEHVGNAACAVHVWDFKHRRMSYAVEAPSQLRSYLDRALGVIDAWRARNST